MSDAIGCVTEARLGRVLLDKLWIIERVTKLEEVTEMSEARLGRVKFDKKKWNILAGKCEVQ